MNLRDVLLFRMELACPACGTPFRTRTAFKMLKWRCSKCGAELYADGERYGSGAGISAGVTVALWMAIPHSRPSPWPGGLFTNPFWWLGLFATTQLIQLFVAPFFIRPVVGKERARGDGPCARCGALIPAKAFSIPWAIHCPHCGTRHVAKLGRHFELILFSGFLAVCFFFILFWDLSLNPHVKWLLGIGLGVFWYFVMAGYMLRPRK